MNSDKPELNHPAAARHELPGAGKVLSFTCPACGRSGGCHEGKPCVCSCGQRLHLTPPPTPS